MIQELTYETKTFDHPVLGRPTRFIRSRHDTFVGVVMGHTLTLTNDVYKPHVWRAELTTSTVPSTLLAKAKGKDTYPNMKPVSGAYDALDNLSKKLKVKMDRHFFYHRLENFING